MICAITDCDREGYTGDLGPLYKCHRCGREVCREHVRLVTHKRMGLGLGYKHGTPKYVCTDDLTDGDIVGSAQY